MTNEARPAGRAPLSPRQLEVLRHATRTNRWTARRLGISPYTVENHWTAIASQLETDGTPYAPRRSRALARALELGIVELDEVDAAADERRWPAGWHLEWHPDYQEESER